MIGRDGHGRGGAAGTARRASCTLAAILVLLCPASLPSQERWTLDLGTEVADTSIGSSRQRWWSGRAQLAYRREGVGAGFLGSETQARDGDTDVTVFASGYRHLGDWTVYGKLSVGPEADFLHRYWVEGEASRRLVGTLVGHLGYRFLEFRAATRHLFMPGATLYLAKGELEARAFLVQDDDLGARGRTLLLRGTWDVHPRVSLGAGVALGTRIFDVSSIAGANADAWTAFGNVRVRLTPRDRIELSVSVSHENPSFDQRAIGLAYRRTF